MTPRATPDGLTAGARTGAVVIVGGGHAGVQAAMSLRAGGHRGRIAVLHGEADEPYQRPPLSKGFLEDGRADRLAFRASAFWTDSAIDLVRARAMRIDRVRGHVLVEDGRAFAYDHLILATGSRARTLDLPGAGDDVLVLEDLPGARRLRDRLARTRHALVIGAGFIGLEFAAAAVRRTIEVEIVDVAARAMQRIASPAISAFFEDRHRRSGVRFRFGRGVAALLRDGDRLRGVRLDDGSERPADLVLAGIGAVPDAELARQAGLATARGVLVDSWLRTSDPRISAIGDCAEMETRTGERLCLASVQNAVDQARHVAAVLLGATAPYAAVPWFWSDQGSDKLQIAGLAAPGDLGVVRGDPATGAFSVFHVRDGALSAVESVNRPADHMLARRLLATGARLTPEQVRDPAFDLKTALGRPPPERDGAERAAPVPPASVFPPPQEIA